MSVSLLAEPPLARILGILRVCLHVMFAFLLGFASVRVLVDAPSTNAGHPILVVALAAVLAGAYLVGTVWEERYSHGQVRTNPAPYSFAWLAVILALWCVLVVASPDFMWLLFPLVIVTLHVLPRTAGIATAMALWAVAAFFPLVVSLNVHGSRTRYALGPGTIIGPAIGTLVAIGIYYGYVAIHREARRNEDLAQALLATQNELTRTMRQSGRMEERERLSREIHDTVAQGLSSIVLISRAARASLREGDSATAAEQIGVIEAQASASLSEARRFVRELNAEAPVTLDEALSDVVASANAASQATHAHSGEPLTIELIIDRNASHGSDPAEPVTRAIVRATQELLANVAKHASATRAVVTLGLWDGAVTLDVVDNGRGFPATLPARTETSGFGLAGVRDRVEALGGTMTIDPGSDPGAAVSIRIPLTSRKEPDDSRHAS